MGLAGYSNSKPTVTSGKSPTGYRRARHYNTFYEQLRAVILLTSAAPVHLTGASVAGRVVFVSEV